MSNVGVSGGTPYGGSPYVSPLSVPYLRYIEWGNTVFSLKFLKNFAKKIWLFIFCPMGFKKKFRKIFLVFYNIVYTFLKKNQITRNNLSFLLIDNYN